MAKARNQVIAGDFSGGKVKASGRLLGIDVGGVIYLDGTSVERFEVLTEDHFKSAASGVARGLVGGALLGPVGMLAGAVSAKNKGIYQVAVQFREERKAAYSGKRSLLELDETLYKVLLKNCF